MDFQYSDLPEPHKERTKQILKAHPEIRKLIGRNSYSAVLVILVVTLQIAIAYFLRDQAWWVTIIVAFLVGAFADHTLFVLIHEASHNLIFKNRTLNTIFGIIADVPKVVPSYVSFKSYHLKHHSFQGDYYLDADLASRWEAKIIGNTFLGKSLWELFFPFFQAFRTMRLKEIEFMNTWVIVNWVFVFAVDVVIIIYFGPIAFIYLVFSLVFSIGLHPLGARWIQEHFLVAPPQETYSYYGLLNIPSLNVGYHNEHHDFPSISWNNLPKVRKTAPEFYDNLVYYNSWFKLWLKFLFDPELSLYSRMIRENRAGIEVIKD
jgi:sphingolipid delta-4 desaturase